METEKFIERKRYKDLENRKNKLFNILKGNDKSTIMILTKQVPFV
jgi:hypothetical protein